MMQKTIFQRLIALVLSGALLLLLSLPVGAEIQLNVQSGNSLVLSHKLCIMEVGDTERITIDSLVLNEPSNMPPGGAPPEENWVLSDDVVCTLKLSGGEVATGFNENGPRLNQVADVTAISVGVTTLEVSRIEPGCQVSALCNFVVYKQGVLGTPGDVNDDAQITAVDALEILRHSVGKTQLTIESEAKADIDCNDTVGSEDALYILRIVVGKL